MKIQEIRKIAKRMGLETTGKDKAVVVREIQRREGNLVCFATSRVLHCGEKSCLWRDDCLVASVE